MTVNMTMSLPDDVARYVKAKGNASAYTAEVLRRAMLAEALETLPPRDHDDAFGTAAADAFAAGSGPAA